MLIINDIDYYDCNVKGRLLITKLIMKSSYNCSKKDLNSIGS